MAKVPPFSELIAATTSTAVHLETRDAYTPDDPQFLDWKAGKPIPVPSDPDWYELIRAHVARGVRFRRAHVVAEPLADFTRFEYECTAGLNIAAGEEVRWLPRYGAIDVCVPLNDFWVLDNRVVRFGYFAGPSSRESATRTRRPAAGYQPRRSCHHHVLDLAGTLTDLGDRRPCGSFRR
jgi:hypothetical protein